MSNKFPKSNTAEEIGSGFSLEMPAVRKNSEVVDKSNNSETQSTDKSQKQKAEDRSGNISSNSSSREVKGAVKQPETKAVDQETMQAKPAKTLKKPMKVMTYFGEKDYDEFSDVSDELKRIIRKETGKKLKETHITEIMVLLAVKNYKQNSQSFLTQIREIMQDMD